MDMLLSKVTQQAMNYAIRSGVTITSGYAIRQCARLLKSVEGSERDEIATLQRRLESKIRIISPAIDMIELIAARGNTSLESAVTLTKALRWDIQALGVRLSRAATDEELLRKGSSKAKSRVMAELELKRIISDMKTLLERIEDAVPLINLAITTSGVNLSTTLPSTVSPSRLLQASTFLTAGDTRYAISPGKGVQVGPAFVLSMYMLFSGHAYRLHDEDGIRETTWKEVIHKARVKLMRVPLEKLSELPSSEENSLARSTQSAAANGGSECFPTDIPSEGKAYEFAYQLLIIEDLDDDRVHTFEDDEPQPGPFEEVALAGIREIVPIHEISKIFYADTGKILNIATDGETNNPILLLKRDVNAVPPRRMADRDTNEANWYDEPSPTEATAPNPELDDEDDGPGAQLRRDSSIAPEGPAPVAGPQPQPWRLPPNLDPEWIAFEVYTEEPTSDDEEDESSAQLSEPSPVPAQDSSSRAPSLDPSLTSGLSHLNLRTSPAPTPSSAQPKFLIPTHDSANMPPTSLPALRTSLSLLELLIRLTALQQFQQSSHLAITDELLNFFLSESGTTGAGADTEYRKRVRRQARMRVGFDPYDESPIKRRGEMYIDNYGDHQPPEAGWGADDGNGAYSSPYRGNSPAHARYARKDSPSFPYPSTESRQGTPYVPPSSRLHNLRSPPLNSPSPSPLMRRSTRERAARAGTPDWQGRAKSSPNVLATPPATGRSGNEGGGANRGEDRDSGVGLSSEGQ